MHHSNECNDLHCGQTDMRILVHGENISLKFN